MGGLLCRDFAGLPGCGICACRLTIPLPRWVFGVWGLGFRVIDAGEVSREKGLDSWEPEPLCPK